MSLTMSTAMYTIFDVSKNQDKINNQKIELNNKVSIYSVIIIYTHNIPSIRLTYERRKRTNRKLVFFSRIFCY